MKKKTCTENNKTLEINFNELTYELLKIRVDGDLIDDISVEKCDFLILIKRKDDDTDYMVIILELKGKDVNKAIQQLGSTINLLKNIPGYETILCYQIKRAIAICSRVPIIQSRLQSEIKKFNKKYGFLLIIKSQHLAIRIPE